MLPQESLDPKIKSKQHKMKIKQRKKSFQLGTFPTALPTFVHVTEVIPVPVDRESLSSWLYPMPVTPKCSDLQ